MPIVSHSIVTWIREKRQTVYSAQHICFISSCVLPLWMSFTYSFRVQT